MKESSLRVLKGVGDFLDHPLIRWAGSIGTLLWIASLIVGLLGKIFDSGYEAGANILIAIGALGLLLQLLVTALPRSTTDGDRAADRLRGNVDTGDGELNAAIEAELVTLIDEWKALRPSEFEETANAPYSFLLGRTKEFLETILGRVEAQGFEDNGSENPRTFNQLVDLRIRALSLLRDAADRWRPKVDLTGLRAAVAARKEVDYGSAILIAGSPLDSRYEIPADPDLFDRPSSAETDGEAEEERAAVAVLAPKSDLETALRTERAEGAKLLQALKGGLFQSFLYDRVPTTEDVHGWQANVEHLLHGETELLQLFRWQPLTRTLGLSWASVADVLQGGPEVRRLEGLLAQLDKVIERVSR